MSGEGSDGTSCCFGRILSSHKTEDYEQSVYAVVECSVPEHCYKTVEVIGVNIQATSEEMGEAGMMGHTYAVNSR